MKTQIIENKDEKTKIVGNGKFKWSINTIDKFCQFVFPNAVIRRLWTVEGEFVTLRRHYLDFNRIWISECDSSGNDHAFSAFVELNRDSKDGRIKDFFEEKTGANEMVEKLEKRLAEFESNPKLEIFNGMKNSPKRSFYFSRKFCDRACWATVLISLILLFVLPREFFHEGNRFYYMAAGIAGVILLLRVIYIECLKRFKHE